ncbi:imidazole glycerol phosphate synthase subunit HisH [Paractinoplanes ferrugineus]|uniref:Imidazole glycerol phosphate synthase subunit HisH n=1 Tax=Paractinoplanes ferrugineus TaxID=113564 RepID=A0A919J5C8_9ACTN|nr:imidazole glycerol phosphate synthase subunit HisH [Actinoplanes ferrugineus]GIE14303.1 imidazole glycerol phosphate synthase subunit HisH [Actinoplanes ferrugineus]
MTSVVILDYGSGNLRSAERAVARTGVDVRVSSDLDAAADADGLFVPGVGAYAACMAGIEALGAGPVIAGRVAAGKPVLGVCVGMQILFDSGVEHGVRTKGLGLLPGVVSKLDAARIPHMGWNTVDLADGSDLFGGLDPQARFYFVHSYAAKDLDLLHRAGAKVTTASHDRPFAAAVELGSLAAAQFHPEKSADAGYALLRNWVAGL